LVSVVVAARHGREGLRELIEGVHGAMASAGISCELIVVGDGSRDGAAEAAMRPSDTCPVRVMVREGRGGLSSAILAGIREARGEIVVVIDAGLQHPPGPLPDLVRAILGGSDLAIGSRYAGGGSVRGWFPLRRLVYRAACLLVRLLVMRARRIRDPLSGLFALRRQAIEGVELRPRGSLLLEVLARGIWVRVTEVPIAFRPRERGESKLGIREIIDYSLQLIDLAHSAARFPVVGALGTLVNLGAVALLGYALGIEHLIASVVALEASTLFNFVLHEKWTFRFGFRDGVLGRLLRFHTAVAVHVLVQPSVSGALHYLLGAERVLSQLLGILAGFALNYLISSRAVWVTRRPSS